MNKFIFTVYQINDYVRGLLNRDPILSEVWIRGEISNIKIHSSGHIYFTLKDEQAKIKCVMFRQNTTMLDFIPCDGMKIVASGQISLYCRDGQYQFYLDTMEKDGVGDLHAAFEALKEKLKKEGLFETNTKKPIPSFPKKVAVITSHTGAAVKDIINVIKRRCNLINILIIPVLVQGVEAAQQISAALDYANMRNDIDVIILGRGGGSIEELWAFNEEKVARAIWRSNIPIISAVGHETDFTIADFVADLRAATPSAAAELAAPDLSYIKQMTALLQKKLVVSINNQIKRKQHNLQIITDSYVMKYPYRIFEQKLITVDKMIDRLLNTMNSITLLKRERFVPLAARLDASLISPSTN